jgi:CHAT domain-containing protein/Tfp pilus assembly protein PilF
MNNINKLRMSFAASAIACLVLVAGLLAPASGHAQAQISRSPDKLLSDAVAAFTAKDYPHAITLLQERLRVLMELQGQSSPQAVAAYKDVADVQNNYANVLSAAGKTVEALALFRAVLAERERRTGGESIDTAISLNRVALHLEHTGQYGEALPLYQRVLAIFEKAQGPEHPSTATSLNNLAQLYKAMGHYAEAIALSRRALAITEKVQGPEHPATGFIAGNLAALYRSMGLYAEALPLSRRALAIVENAQGPEHADTGIYLNNLALLYKSMGQTAEALPLYRRALAITEKAQGAEHPDTGIRLNNLAELYRAVGLYADALPLYQRALAITEKARGAEHPETGVRLNNFAALYVSMGQYAEALPLYRRALAIAVKTEGPQHPSTAGSLNNLALLYEFLGQNAAALPLYQRALAIREKVQGAGHPETGVSLNNLAALYASMGLYTEALPLSRRALAIAEQAQGSEHPETGGRLNNLAFQYAAIGQYGEALPLFRRALLIANNSESPELAWNVLNNLRTVHVREKQPGLAIYFGKQAVNTLQGMRTDLSRLERDLQRGFLTNKISVYRNLADVLIQQGRIAEAQQVLGMLKEEEFFDFVRRIETDDPRQRRIAFQPDEQPWQQRFSALTARLGKGAIERADMERRAALGLSDTDKARLAELLREKDVLGAELQRYFHELAAAFVSAKGLNTNAAAAVAQLKATQKTLSALSAGSVLVQYVLSESRLNIIFTTASAQLSRQIDISSADLNQKIEFFRVALQAPEISAQPMAQELYKLLIAPIEQDLRTAKARTLMFSLDGPLRYIPLSALHDGRQYLIERYDLSLYTEVTRDNLELRPGKNMSIAGLGVTRQIDEFSSLPAVRTELNAIVRNGNQGLIKGELHFDEQFNLLNLKQALQNKRPLLHLASHFVFRPGNESTSFLLLGDGDRLTLSRIREEKLDFSHVDLVTLSACETGVGGGRTAQGEEVEGLGALVQKQGAKGVIATLWPVDDESTGLLMRNFYRLREEQKLSKAGALRQAQVMLITGQLSSEPGNAQGGLGAASAATPKPAALYAHPYFWAPFILMGNWL